MRSALAAVAACLLASCTGARGRSCEQPFQFPPAFDALQVVRVTSDGQLREILASIRKRGADYQIAFLDPAIQRPFLEVEIAGGKMTQKGELPAEAKAQLPRLIDAIRELYAASCFSGSAERMELTGSRFKYQLEKFSGPADCRFPGLVHMAPRLGSSVSIAVETNDLACPSP